MMNDTHDINYENIIYTVNLFEYISFDIFDTLLKRDVKDPKDVFKLLELKATKKFGDGVIGLAASRIKAELIARKRSRHEEVSLQEIYNILEEKYNSTICLYCRLHEIKLERSLAVENVLIKKVFNFCKQSGKKIIAISDMYLSKELIVTLLDKCGYSDLYNIYVSSEIKKTKRTGSMYDFILNDLNINPNQIIHIGDNYNSDYIECKKHGVKSILIPARCNNLLYNKFRSDILENRLIAFQNNRVLKLTSLPMQLGYEGLGPLLFGFSKWLQKRLEKENIQDVFFLSRDGELLKKSFDIVNSNSDLVSHYLYASRRALIVPALKLYPNLINFLEHYSIAQITSPIDFMKAVGAEKFMIDAIIDDLSIDGKTLHRISNEQVLFSQIYIKLRNLLCEQIESEYESAKKYFMSKCFRGKVAVVDIGWFGNMQSNLINLLHAMCIDCDVYGFYVGLARECEHKIDNHMEGYLIDGDNTPLESDCLLASKAIFELFFSGSHGSVKKYDSNENAGVEFLDYEFDDPHSIEVIKNYQSGGIQFVSEANKASLAVTREFASKCIFNQIMKPRLEEALLWGSMQFLDGKKRSMCSKPTIRRYLRNPKSLINDYRQSCWQIGFLKHLFRIDLPYNNVVVFSKKHNKKNFDVV